MHENMEKPQASESPKPVRTKTGKKALAADAQWCLDHIDTLTTNSFYDEFADQCNDIIKLSRRYKNMIDKELKGTRGIPEARKEQDKWVKSKQSTN
ncbi:hypothetical protein MBANPS3_012028 [Mucor bainieri]